VIHYNSPQSEEIRRCAAAQPSIAAGSWLRKRLHLHQTRRAGGERQRRHLVPDEIGRAATLQVKILRLAWNASSPDGETSQSRWTPFLRRHDRASPALWRNTPGPYYRLNVIEIEYLHCGQARRLFLKPFIKHLNKESGAHVVGIDKVVERVFSGTAMARNTTNFTTLSRGYRTCCEVITPDNLRALRPGPYKEINPHLKAHGSSGRNTS
jgi:hypothetical protein